MDFSPRNGWNLQGFKEAGEDEDEDDGRKTGTAFEDVDLTDKEWADYDDKSDLSTCISEFEHQFVKVK